MSNLIIIRQPVNELEFEAMFDLRWRVLREPWSQPRGSERDDREVESFPFIALLDNRVVGTARLQVNDSNIGEGQVRYLAVEKEHRNTYIGNDLFNFIEWYAKKKELKYLVLNARKTASGFFKKLNYEIIGDGPTIFNEIEHYVMKKLL